MTNSLEMTQQTVADGAFEGIPFDVYASVDAINGSSIVHMRRSPMFYRYMKDSPQPPTPAMILGTATHRLILEPNRVDDFAIWGLQEEEKVRRGKVWDTFKDANMGKMCVTVAESEAMIGMAVAARKNLPIRKYADAKGPTEVSLFWHENGVRFKCRLDKWIPDKRTVFDLKTTRDCRGFKFGTQAYSLGYNVKMAIQWSGVRAVYDVEPRLKLGAVESKAPHESAVFNLTPDVLISGLQELEVLLAKKAECEETGIWPAAQPEEVDLVLPAWASAESDTELGLEM